MINPQKDRSPESVAERFLTDVGGHVQQRFVSGRVIQSFEEYLQLFFQDPRRHARSAAQYLRDAMDYSGVTAVPTPVGEQRRFQLFNGDSTGVEEGIGIGVRVAGQEEAQNAIYRQVSNFVRAGRVNKLILLHGPNGSAKSSLISALSRSLEVYSRLAEGARYRFNWVFPSDKLVKGSIGFGGKPGSTGSGNLETYAHLEGEAIEARIQCELKDTPLFLIPRDERRKLLEQATQASARGSEGANDFILSDYILEGELCQKCRAIYSALLAHHSGDYLRVLRHVQVERFFVSRRYMSAAAVVEPQMSVDADYRQVTADASHMALPAALQNLVLYAPFGALVSGNRGVVDFSDLLKRPLEAYKYLLGTCETATVAMGPFIAQLDAVLIASSNEKHLAAFKEIPDFASFKARIELVRVPYLRRFSVEKEIYDQQLDGVTVGKHIAPHTTRVVALWAVLTRLKKPIVDRFKGAVRSVIDDLTPIEKLVLYDQGRAPDRLSLSQANELRSQLHALYHESDAYPNYEGRSGASAREMKTVLFNAAQHPQYKCLTPLAVLEELGELVKDKTVYEFLQQDRVDGYHAHEEFVRVAESDYLDVIDEEIRESMGLVSEKQYRELFERYLQHVSASIKGETLQNKLSGAYEKPDEELMASTDAILMTRGQDRREFRRSLIASVGAYRLDHPDRDIDYAQVFPDLFRRLRDHYFEERRKTLRRNKENFLRYLSDDRSSLLERDRLQVEKMLTTLRTRFGYCEHCGKDAIMYLMQKRYSD
jgi:predicted Ser/Thr protein kinase